MSAENTSGSFAAWSAKQLKLLALEQAQGVERHAAKRFVLSKLQLADVKIGAFGKTTLVLTRDKPIVNGFQVGSPVKLTCPRWGPDGERRGVVKISEEDRIEVICKGDANENSSSALEPSHEHDISIESVPDETTIKRTTKALAEAESTRWAKLLFGDGVPRFKPEPAGFMEQASLSSLNDSQRKAVSLVSRALDLGVIHGPPGTGKTTTLIKVIESILQINPSARILCCAPSNVAVDNLVGLLGRKKMRLVRLGHPSRVNPALLEHTLDSVLANSDMAALVKDAKNELLETRDKFRKRELRKEIKSREKNFLKSFIADCQIVLSTISSSNDVAKLAPQDFSFTHLIVDEAAQAAESSIWIPLQFLDPANGVLILAGDHMQLPPTILSDEAARAGLGFTMMERIVNKFKDECAVVLATQYRMCQEIMGWSSKEMYDNVLVADDAVAARRLRDILPTTQPLGTIDKDFLHPLIFIDTAACGLNEQDLDLAEASGEAAESRSNTGEVEIVFGQVDRLLHSGLRHQDIAVVTPYRAQVEAIKSRLSESPSMEAIEVRTVDGFQGQEREVIILSMVRSNPERKVGFLADERRLNVAITRAKRQVCLIGDSLTLESNAFLETLVKYFWEHGTVRSAAEFVQTFEGNGQPHAPRASRSKSSTPNKVAPPSIKQPPAKSTISAATKNHKPAIASASAPISQAALQTKIKAKMTPNFAPDKPRDMPFSTLGMVDESDDDDGNEPDVPPISQDPITAQPPATTNSRTKSKKKKPVSKASTKEDEDQKDDDWDFLEAAAKAATHCAQPKCEASIALIWHDCAFCKQRFCLAHRQAELHGCGVQARKHAFQSNTTGTPLRPSERAKLKDKLNDKIKQEEKGRAAVVQPKKKG